MGGDGTAVWKCSVGELLDKNHFVMSGAGGVFRFEFGPEGDVADTLEHGEVIATLIGATREGAGNSFHSFGRGSAGSPKA